MNYCYAVWWSLTEYGETLENIEGVYSTLEKAREVCNKLNAWARENEEEKIFYVLRYKFDNMNVILRKGKINYD